ncbi:MAG: site-specific integrase [Sulfolobales archaeon]
MREALLQSETLKIWLDKVTNTEATRKDYIDRIEEFYIYAKQFGVDITTLKEQWRLVKYDPVQREQFLDKLQDLVEAFFSDVRRRNISELHKKTIMAIASSYLKKGCGIKDIEVPIPKRPYIQYHNRDITKEEIKKILEHASLRDRTFFLMMVESGLRPSTLLQLRYKHIKDDYEKGIVPMKINLPSEILKDRISSRFTFIGEDGYRLLKEYLSTRGPLGPEDLIFLPEQPTRAKRETIGVTAISQKFNKLVLKLGLDKPIGRKPKSLRLYCLRKYFWNNMKCDSTFRAFWFCHSSINDHYISTTDIERHREEYLKGYQYLRIYEPSSNHEALRAMEIRVKELEQTVEKQRAQLEHQQKVIALLERTKEVQAFHELFELKTQVKVLQEQLALIQKALGKEILQKLLKGQATLETE